MKDEELDCELVLACLIHEIRETTSQATEEAKKAPKIKIKIKEASQRDFLVLRECMDTVLTRLINLIRYKELRDRVAQNVKPQDHPYWVEKGEDYD